MLVSGASERLPARLRCPAPSHWQRYAHVVHRHDLRRQAAPNRRRTRRLAFAIATDPLFLCDERLRFEADFRGLRGTRALRDSGASQTPGLALAGGFLLRHGGNGRVRRWARLCVHFDSSEPCVAPITSAWSPARTRPRLYQFRRRDGLRFGLPHPRRVCLDWSPGLCQSPLAGPACRSPERASWWSSGGPCSVFLRLSFRACGV